MAKYITDLDVSLNEQDEDYLTAKGFKKLHVNLNRNNIPEVYLWYKEGSSDPITRIQFSFTDSMAEGLDATGFMKVGKNLYSGTSGGTVFLWFIRGNTESHVPITKIEVTHDDEAGMFASGWERIPCNPNRGTREFWAFLWVHREKKTYIQDMKVTVGSVMDGENFSKGYIRVDESTNRSRSGKPVFLWYLPTTKEEGCYVSLQVSTNEEEEKRYENEGFHPVIPRVNLNKGNQGNKVYLWYKKEDPGQKPIQNISLLSNPDYKKVGVTVLPGNLNSGDGCPWFPATPLYLAYYN